MHLPPLLLGTNCNVLSGNNAKKEQFDRGMAVVEETVGGKELRSFPLRLLLTNCQRVMHCDFFFSNR